MSNRKVSRREDFAHRTAFGKEAERITVDYLLERGYTIYEQNWRPKNSHLEVDIIAGLGNVMAFVEVKARSADGGDPVEAVTPDKQRKLARAADIYLRMQPCEYDYRFDIAAIAGTPEEYTFEYIEDAFLSPLCNF